MLSAKIQLSPGHFETDTQTACYPHFAAVIECVDDTAVDEKHFVPDIA